MSLKDVRKYFQDRLKEINPDFTEHKDAFNIENIGNNTLDKSYHIFYGDIATTESNQTCTKDTVLARVTLFFKGYSDPAEALDDSMDTANNFRLLCMSPKYATRNVNIKNVVCKSIKATPVPTNDNSFLITLEFNISTIFSVS